MSCFFMKIVLFPFCNFYNTIAAAALRRSQPQAGALDYCIERQIKG
jgi:hypothetical protein